MLQVVCRSFSVSLADYRSATQNLQTYTSPRILCALTKAHVFHKTAQGTSCKPKNGSISILYNPNIVLV